MVVVTALQKAENMYEMHSSYRKMHSVTGKAGNRKQEWEFAQKAAWAEMTPLYARVWLCETDYPLHFKYEKKM